jgi:hypothetical protein
MAARPWELVLPIEERMVPHRITTSTSHRMLSVAPLGCKENEARSVMQQS